MGDSIVLRCVLFIAVRDFICRDVKSFWLFYSPDFVNAPPKLRLGHPTFRLITIYNSVLGICYLHCR